MVDLTDRIAIVTGGASGIGKGICMVLAEAGAIVVVADINAINNNAVEAEITDKSQISTSIVLDVRKQESVDHLVTQVAEQFNHIDILVNNAGLVGAPNWWKRDQPSEEDWEHTLEVNLKGMVRVSEAVAVHMRERMYGKIVNIASVGGRQGTLTHIPYGVSKAGVINLTQASALELAPFNINVNSICPGLLWTPIWETISYRLSLDSEKGGGLSPREIFDRTVKERVPLGREQTPEDIGNTAAFLASDYASNITGQAINVSGGLFMN